MKDVREKVYRFRVNNEESEIIERKYMLSEYKSMSEFFRDMVIGGMIIEVDRKLLLSSEKLIKKSQIMSIR